MKETNVIEDSKTFSGLPAPDYWSVTDRRPDGLMWQRTQGEAIKIIESIAIEKDGKRWLHVSVSKPSKAKMPTYEDIQVMRKLFVGEHRECYMVFPPAERYVNINPVLHLWTCLDEEKGVLPQFDGVVNGKVTV